MTSSRSTKLAGLPSAAQAWVEQTLQGLSIQEKIGQLFFPTLTPDFLRSEGFAEDDLAGFCREFGLGGGHLFGGEFETVREWSRQAQAAGPIPMLLSGDLDRGGGNRLKGGVLFPYQMALGAADSEELAYELGRAIALESRLAGYNWTFGPIVDLCASPDYARHIAAIGEDPEQVARLAVAQIRGIQEHGMAACAKHFPGDGHDDRDQHLITLTNPLSAEEWRAQSALPFQRSIDAGVWSIMVAGIAVPSIDPACSADGIPLPAVFSKKLIQDVLRGEMGFEGLLVADALNMGGVSCHYPRPERYLKAFEAGIDALLFISGLKATQQCFLDALEQGRITESRLDESVRRILEMKARLQLHDPAEPPKIEPGATEFKQTARQLAKESITLLRDRDESFPPELPAGSRIAHVLVTNREEEFDPSVFARELEAAGHTVETMVNPQTAELYDRTAAGEFDLVVTSFFYPIQWGWGTVRCHGPFIRSAMSGYHLANPQTKHVFISWGGPFHLYEMPYMDPYLVTYGEPPCSQRAAAGMILGQLPVKGRVPVSMSGYFEKGDGIRT